ncbi:hypothetical protein MPDQ_005777 [Monascus purpureus]|uniref:SCD domain-containing protein n=1 Tax=Monascus purpureus TaxID=5098 RepID=A0A507QZQ7_MONPU|nr:hypothetical protein MPDQ_005777 [Monascus purpureus]BDD55206.1 hypothetical protein MAP00_000752 [Monascus purpureus]
MENETPLSSPNAGQTMQKTSSSPSTDRRKSGRVTRKPELFSQTYGEITGRTKRKRPAAGDGDDGDAEEEEDGDAEQEDVSSSDEDDASDDDPDEEELRERKRAARKALIKQKKSTAGKGTARATKKPKVATNGIGNQELALRPATNGKRKTTVSRPRKPKVRPSLAAGESGLYAEVFGKSGTVDDVAAQWLTRYQQDKSDAMHEMVNFILRCTGTDLTVDTDQVNDVDNVPDRISDLQELYNERGISEYPLISKSRTFKAFQPVLEDFFSSLIQTFHHSSVLYNDKDLFENILIWVSSMSTAQCRPFRHTATLISLIIMTALCDVAREVTTTVSTSRKQLESEKKKKTINKGRTDAIQKTIQEGEKKLEAIDEFLKDGFDTVFVHRYRDIDPKIRSECIASLGQWLRSYREYFFEGQYLRYFGWTLSDRSAHTRLVVVTQLRSLYENKDNIVGLRSLTERFRQRMVEMAAQDADPTVRVSAVELLDFIRDAGLLEPEDIDTIGKLVFDSEPSIRKAAGRFFVANVQDVFDSITEEVGEEINELFADEDEDDFESPKRSWIKFKCLADILHAYDEQENKSKPEQLLVAQREALSGAPVVSRFVLATEAIYPYIEELSQWQSLAGYLLYDHSQIADSPSEEDTAGAVRKLYKMEEGQEVILLEVLCCAVKLRILDVSKSDIDKRGRKVKALTNKIPELQEEIAHGLTQIIPRLLKKFGAVPEAASAVLRLEHLVDLDKIQDLQKDAAAYSSLLNDINKQFLTHSHQDVLTEASVAFVHAKTSDELKEALETRTQELWDDMVDALSALSQEKDVQNGESLSATTLNAFTNTVTRISNLASVTDCTNVLETAPSPRSKGKNGKLDAPFNVLIHLSNRGLLKADDEETAKVESELVTSSIRTLLFYFMWKIQGLTAAFNAGKSSFDTAYFESLSKNRKTFVETLVTIMGHRSGLDDIRFAATTTLLDVQTLFGTLRHAGQAASNNEEVLAQMRNLIQEISPEDRTLISKIHSIAERTYARKLGRSLETADDDDLNSEPEVEDEPLEDEDESEESEADEEEAREKSTSAERLRGTLLAEQRLCELTGKIVLAIIGRIIDTSNSQQKGSLKQRLLRNKSRLGHNYKEVLSFLDGRKVPGAGAGKTARSKKQTGGEAKKASSTNNDKHKSAERVDEDDGEEDDEEDLRARELVEDEELNPPDPEENGNDHAEDEDEVMGD